MDKVGVRQAGGRGGDRPVCRVDGLNNKNNRKVTINKSKTMLWVTIEENNVTSIEVFEC